MIINADPTYLGDPEYFNSIINSDCYSEAYNTVIRNRNLTVPGEEEIIQTNNGN